MPVPCYRCFREKSRSFTAMGLMLCLLSSFPGCRFFPSYQQAAVEMPTERAALLENPLLIPAGDREFIWNQIVDELDNYFYIQREERVRLESGILTEGQIDTRPQVGATIFEPWRNDSTNGYERTHATLQTIRRTAKARVIPVETGYLLNLVVLKELEDLDKPVQASAGAVLQRYDTSLIREQVPPGTFPITPGWISLGRDVSLEQQILANLKSRLCDPNTPARLK